MYNCILRITAVTLLFAATAAYSGAALLYLEAQGVAGYTGMNNDLVLYSMSQEDVMQKPGFGFDYVQKLSGATGDFATIALQARAAYDTTYEHNIEPQLYNAYINGKFSFADIWAGHNRPAMGISSYTDSHAQLLPTISMLGFGYDRDWGIGANHDFSFGDIRLSATTGSGMPLYFKNNYLLSARFSTGVLNQDNYNLGFTASYGEVLDTMGYHLMNDMPMNLTVGGIDFTLLWNNIELRLEGMGGSKDDKTAVILFARISINLMDENRLKFEIQPVYSIVGDAKNYQLYNGLAVIANSDLTFRAMYHYDYAMREHMTVMQVYYYLRVI